jgi:hypothetical protein
LRLRARIRERANDQSLSPDRSRSVQRP